VVWVLRLVHLTSPHLFTLPAEYEAEAWETGSHRSEETYRTGLSKPRTHAQSGRESPRSYQNPSQSGDYYRDTNVMSNRNLRNKSSRSNISHNAGQATMSQYGGVPQLPQMPLGGGFNTSAVGSDYGGVMAMPMLPYQNTGSIYGMQAAPPGVMMPGLNMFGGPIAGGLSPSQSAVGAHPPSLPSAGVDQRPLSTFSYATTVNPFAGPSQNPEPTDEELFQALRNYLSTQDLMTVTKK
jgi:chitin synthase